MYVLFEYIVYYACIAILHVKDNEKIAKKASISFQNQKLFEKLENQ